MREARAVAVVAGWATSRRSPGPLKAFPAFFGGGPGAPLPRTLIGRARGCRAMRAFPLAILLVLLAPLAASEVAVRSPCNDWLPEEGVVDRSCKPIHPGARMWNGCTLNWVVTDGTDLYIATAGHCVGAIGEPLRIDGLEGSMGTLVFRGVNDSAFYRIAPEARPLVDGALRQWGGKTIAVTGVSHRPPAPGEPMLHYGWGYYTADTPELRGRPAVALLSRPATPYTDSSLIVFATPGISGGDSGSPIMTVAGEAAGIVVAGVFPVGLACGVTGVCPVDAPGNVGVAVSLHTEIKHFSRTLKKPVTLVTGDPLVST